ncbi:MAG: Asp-tRNA(Asn)/Glu-tRNA(Gln) amidotransferase subunit GatB [Mycoplasmoidaceae bacterium]|nr:MAG: Asp-tRNA(Asn)/Glu-tRNA(Gln) amidotransferase subunit GatB [Mycoplasmoidaceae bacterium]
MYKLAIGLEIHTELLTKTKMFSSAKNDALAKPNTCVDYVDLGLPGALPIPNKQAVILGIKLAKALNMKIDKNLVFDRKNYFYVDLPKGFQITQFYHPLGKNGNLGNVGIEEIHLEEDTAKQNKDGNNIILDYNRAGVPLLEIVTKPNITSKEQCIEFLDNLKRILINFGISDGKMENGSLRVDLNISVSKTNTLGVRSEIKNINSFNNILDAIDYEYKRQSTLLDNNKKLTCDTRRYDDSKKQTVFMRNKASIDEYRYIAEPNIINIDISDLINQTTISKDDTPENIKADLLSKGINEGIIEQLLNNNKTYKIFKTVNNAVNDINLTVTWVITELQKVINDNNSTIDSINDDIVNRIIDMINAIKTNVINSKQAKTMIQHIYSTNKSVKDLIKELGFAQITDESIISNILNKYIQSNNELVSQYKERPERVEKFLLGMLMKDTNGQANPIISKKILDSLLTNLKI